jgi:hypothetical protein
MPCEANVGRGFDGFSRNPSIFLRRPPCSAPFANPVVSFCALPTLPLPHQLVLNGELEPAKASRMVYVLREIRCAIESETLERLEGRLAEVATTVGAVRNGHPLHAAPNQPWH